MPETRRTVREGVMATDGDDLVTWSAGACCSRRLHTEMQRFRTDPFSVLFTRYIAGRGIRALAWDIAVCGGMASAIE